MVMTGEDLDSEDLKYLSDIKCYKYARLVSLDMERIFSYSFVITGPTDLRCAA
jgi:hypothetical protein